MALSAVPLGTRKVAIVGAGYVGSTIAYSLALRDVAREVVLVDTNNAKAEGEAADIRHGLPVMGTADVHAGGYGEVSGCDLIIITAGRGRLPRESRLDLAAGNAAIMQDVVNSIEPYYDGGCILVISNPVDVLTYEVAMRLGLPDGRVFGSGCILDTSRLVRRVADHLGLSTGVVGGYVVGEHGDAQTPVWSRVSVAGIPVAEYCAEVGLPWDTDVRNRIAADVRGLGSSIISAKGRTHFGIATCVCQLADSVLNQRPTIVSVSSVLAGEHGVRDVALSVPSVVGPGGVQQRIRERWEPAEYRAFFDAALALKSVIASL